MIVEGMCVACIGHGETLVPSRGRRIGVEHCNVGFDGNDSDETFSNSVCVLIAWGCGLNAIAVGGRCLKEGVGAVVVLRVKAEETSVIS